MWRRCAPEPTAAAGASALVEIDPKQFQLQNDDHFESHFGIVGLTMPTPVSDRQHVYVLCGLGVAACYDLDGHREWITRLPADLLTYGSSPALADGTLDWSLPSIL